MPRPLRRDHPGALQHVFNQGIGHRAIFESANDVAFFLFLVGRMVEAGLIEVHAYCVMTTHFHLLVTSPRGRLDEAMQHIQDAFARWFNRTRDRVGGVFRDRYRSKHIENDRYRNAVLWYIDRNPVEAGLVTRSVDYPYGSATHYRNGTGPSWLSRSLVEGIATVLQGGGTFDSSRYGELTKAASASRLWQIVDRLVSSQACPPEQLLDLVGAAPAFLQKWLRENAASADGGPTGTLLLHADTVRSVIQELRSSEATASGRGQDWEEIEAGLLYLVAGMPLHDIAATMRSSPATALRRVRNHRQRMGVDQEYVRRSSAALSAGLRLDYEPVM